jgi:hypothetical protein
MLSAGEQWFSLALSILSIPLSIGSHPVNSLFATVLRFAEIKRSVTTYSGSNVQKFFERRSDVLAGLV